MKSASCRYQSPDGRGCYPWGQFCAGASPMAQPTSTGQKIWSLAFFVEMVKLSVKAFEGLKRENAFISATRPSIKILSTLFTIKLLILGAATPKISKKVGIYGQKWHFLVSWIDNCIFLQFHKFHGAFSEKQLFLARYPYLFNILGVAETKIKSWIVKSVLMILIEGLVAEI